MSSAFITDGPREADMVSRHGACPRFGKASPQKLTDEETGQLLSLTALSLSAFQVNHCRFVLVRDPEVKRRLLNHFPIDNHVTPASSLLVLCAALGQEGPGKDPPPPVEKDRDGNGETAGAGTGRPTRDEAMCACGIAAQTLMLTAKALGFDCRRLQGVDLAAVGALINLPEDFAVAALLVLGKNLQPPWPEPDTPPYHQVVVIDRF